MKNRTIQKSVVAGFVFALAQNVSAGLINFDTCLTNCGNFGVPSGGELTSVATLSYSDNGAGGLDFLLTNTVDAYDPSQTNAFLSELFLDFTSLPSGSEGESSNIDDILIDLNAFNIGGNLFDVKVDFANTGARRAERILANNSAQWTLNDLTEQDISEQSVVLMQRVRNDSGHGASRLIGNLSTGQVVQQVPEPAALAMFALSFFGLFAGRLRRKTLSTAPAATVEY